MTKTHFQTDFFQNVKCKRQYMKIKHVFRLPLDQERRERSQHRRRAGQPDEEPDLRWRRQHVRAAHRAAPGHPGFAVAGPAAGQQGVGHAQLQQGRWRAVPPPCAHGCARDLLLGIATESTIHCRFSNKVCVFCSCRKGSARAGHTCR